MIVGTTPFVIAHRGASAYASGNTLAAFRLALEQGADWVELDVRLTADGSCAIHHDAHLLSGAAIGELDAADLPEHVCSLAEALDSCVGMGVNVEIKNGLQEKGRIKPALIARIVATELAVSGFVGPLLVTSFDLATIDAMRAYDDRWDTGWLTVDSRDPEALVETAVASGHCSLNPWNTGLETRLVEHAHASGLSVNVWTVDDPNRMAELAALGVDGIITNRPDVCRLVLDS